MKVLLRKQSIGGILRHLVSISLGSLFIKVGESLLAYVN